MVNKNSSINDSDSEAMNSYTDYASTINQIQDYWKINYL